MRISLGTFLQFVSAVMISVGYVISVQPDKFGDNKEQLVSLSIGIMVAGSLLLFASIFL